MPDTPDAVRLVLRDALADVYAGADLADVDALLDQMTDRGLRVAALAVHVCPPCPHIQTSDEGTSYCDLAEQTHADCVPRAEHEGALREHEFLAEALSEAEAAGFPMLSEPGEMGSTLSWFIDWPAVVERLSEHLPTGGAE